jgi:hypothetical protein
MALVAGVVFFVVRALLALSPVLALRHAIKKWAALAALIAAFFYLLLSGAEVATQPSFIMTAIVLVAVMLDRSAITMGQSRADFRQRAGGPGPPPVSRRCRPAPCSAACNLTYSLRRGEAQNQAQQRMSKAVVGSLVFATALVAFAAGCLFATSSGPETVGKFLVETLSDPKTATAVASAMFALLSLVVQLHVGGRQAVIGARQAEASRLSAQAAVRAARDAGARAVATLRMSWIEKLRTTLAEYHAILGTVDDPIPDADRRRLADLGTQLDLMMNLEEDRQRQLWEIADEIYNLPDRDARQERDPALMAAGRAVLKAEWEKVKSEMRGDDLHLKA